MLLNFASLDRRRLVGRRSPGPIRARRSSAARRCRELAARARDDPISWIPPERLPTPLLVLMPGRYLNFGAMTFVALLIGLLASRRELWSRLVLLFLVVRSACGRSQHAVGISRAPSPRRLPEPRQAVVGRVAWRRRRSSPAPVWTRSRPNAPKRPSHRTVAPIAPDRTWSCSHWSC